MRRPLLINNQRRSALFYVYTYRKMIFGKINEIMKKMQVFMVLLLTAMTVFFTSCPGPDSGPDINPTNEELIKGKWECTRMDYEAEEIGSDYFSKGNWIWKFDGEDIVMYVEGNYDETYRYEIEGDKLYTEYASYFMAQYFEITTLNDTKLVLDVSYQYQGHKGKYSFVFKRI